MFQHEIACLGHIAYFKIKILPPILCPFYNLTISIPMKSFKELQSLILKYFWKNIQFHVQPDILYECPEMEWVGHL